MKPAVIKVAAKAAIDVVTAENAPQAISHTTIGSKQAMSGTSQTTIGSKQTTMIKRRTGDEEAMLIADDNMVGSKRPLGDAPEAGRRKDVTGYKPHCGVERSVLAT